MTPEQREQYMKERQQAKLEERRKQREEERKQRQLLQKLKDRVCLILLHKPTDHVSQSVYR